MKIQPHIFTWPSNDQGQVCIGVLLHAQRDDPAPAETDQDIELTFVVHGGGDLSFERVEHDPQGLFGHGRIIASTNSPIPPARVVAQIKPERLLEGGSINVLVLLSQGTRVCWTGEHRIHLPAPAAAPQP